MKMQKQNNLTLNHFTCGWKNFHKLKYKEMLLLESFIQQPYALYLGSVLKILLLKFLNFFLFFREDGVFECWTMLRIVCVLKLTFFESLKKAFYWQSWSKKHYDLKHSQKFWAEQTLNFNKNVFLRKDQIYNNFWNWNQILN